MVSLVPRPTCASTSSLAVCTHGEYILQAMTTRPGISGSGNETTYGCACTALIRLPPRPLLDGLGISGITNWIIASGHENEYS